MEQYNSRENKITQKAFEEQFQNPSLQHHLETLLC